jgi:hypothetical protein
MEPDRNAAIMPPHKKQAIIPCDPASGGKPVYWCIVSGHSTKKGAL